MPQILQHMVLDFHEQMGQVIGDPRCPDITTDQDLRLKILNSELQELRDAIAANDVVEVADALGDIVYVLQGCAITWGIDLASVIEEIHRSNMTKSKACLDAINAAKLDGSYVQGKLSKGENFSPADIKSTLVDAAANLDYSSEEGWWRKPTALKHKMDRLMQEPPPVSKKLKTAAAMKSIQEDFVIPGPQHPDDTGKPELVVNTRDEDAPDFGANQMPPEMSEKILKVQEARPYSWQFTKWGGLVFDCPCGRSHVVQATLGSRGGMASGAEKECICGKAFKIQLAKGHDPQITETTIEELRKEA